jgi:hypothetical protein
MSDLIPLENINALQVFTEDGIDTLLNAIAEEVADFEPDLSTAKSRGLIKSTAYKVTLSKGVIDRAGADLVKDWKQKAKLVDDSRRKARDFLDELSTRVRQPLTDYEEETARMQAEAEHKARILKLHDEALADHDLWLREQALAAKEAKIQAEEEERQRIEQERHDAEQARLAKEAAEKKEAERQAQIKADAQAQAAREAEEKIEAERKRAEQAEREKKNAEEIARRKELQAAEKAEQEKAAAIEAERLRMVREQAEKDAFEKAERDKAAKIEAERQADADHRRKVNQGALKALVDNNFTVDQAKAFITVVFQNKIPGMRMVY